jgi:phage terminase large subunit-like protein
VRPSLAFDDAELFGGTVEDADLADAATAPLAAVATRVDPLRRLLDPRFVDVTWNDEEGRVYPGARHPKQIEAGSSTARSRWLFWGNQTGKTTWGAQEAALLALGRHPFLQRWQPPLVGWASALTWELWENILLPELLLWIPQGRIVRAPPPFRHSQVRSIEIRADNGKISRIVGKAAQQGPALYQSERLHFFWGDEEHPKSIRDEVQPRLLRNNGVEWYTMTPLKGLSWVYHQVYKPFQEGKSDPAAHYVSHAGVADNPSISAEAIAFLTEELKHNPSQLAARLHGTFMKPEGLALPFDETRNLEDLSDGEMVQLIRAGRVYAGLDFGLWRFALVVAVVDREGSMHVVEELFSQRETTDSRAKQLHTLLVSLGAPRGTLIAGDCANPQEILDLNTALSKLKSPYRVSGVTMENKARIPGVKRLENMLNRGAMLIRRNIAEKSDWLLGYNASKPGIPMLGSRLLWEINSWAYPVARDEDAIQKDDPDDRTADGADMMAALRYLVMTWWNPPKAPEAEAPDPWSPEAMAASEEEFKYGRPAQPTSRRMGRIRNR